MKVIELIVDVKEEYRENVLKSLSKTSVKKLNSWTMKNDFLNMENYYSLLVSGGRNLFAVVNGVSKYIKHFDKTRNMNFTEYLRYKSKEKL